MSGAGMDSDRIMELAHQLADAKVAHRMAVEEFGGEGGGLDEIGRTSDAWIKADKALREALQQKPEPSEKKPEPPVYGHISVDTEPNHNIVLTVWDLTGGDAQVACRVRLSPYSAGDTAAALVASANRALREVAQEIAEGDCPECKNFRMVNRDRPGRSAERVHCPACRPNGYIGYPAYPKVGGGTTKGGIE